MLAFAIINKYFSSGIIHAFNDRPELFRDQVLRHG